MELDKEGYDIPTKKLCTVRISRKIVPGYKSYNLGNIFAALRIPPQNRHRDLPMVFSVVNRLFADHTNRMQSHLALESDS
jgi:DNA polymerase-3 subunit epsilon